MQDVEVLAEGECYDAEAKQVPCAGLHTREDFASFTYRGSIDLNAGSVPGTTCDLLFEQYTGVPIQNQDRYVVLVAAGGNGDGTSDATCSIQGPRGALDATSGSARRTDG